MIFKAIHNLAANSFVFIFNKMNNPSLQGLNIGATPYVPGSKVVPDESFLMRARAADATPKSRQGMTQLEQVALSLNKPPQMPPQMPPYTPPQMPPRVPPQMPPQMPPYTPPQMPPYMPPQMPPYMPPQMPPQMPPRLPPYMPPQMPPQMPPAIPWAIVPPAPTAVPIPMVPSQSQPFHSHATQHTTHNSPHVTNKITSKIYVPPAIRNAKVSESTTNNPPIEPKEVPEVPPERPVPIAEEEPEDPAEEETENPAEEETENPAEEETEDPSEEEPENPTEEEPEKPISDVAVAIPAATFEEPVVKQSTFTLSYANRLKGTTPKQPDNAYVASNRSNASMASTASNAPASPVTSIKTKADVPTASSASAASNRPNATAPAAPNVPKVSGFRLLPKAKGKRKTHGMLDSNGVYIGWGKPVYDHQTKRKSDASILAVYVKVTRTPYRRDITYKLYKWMLHDIYPSAPVLGIDNYDDTEDLSKYIDEIKIYGVNGTCVVIYDPMEFLSYPHEILRVPVDQLRTLDSAYMIHQNDTAKHYVDDPDKFRDSMLYIGCYLSLEQVKLMRAAGLSEMAAYMETLQLRETTNFEDARYIALSNKNSTSEQRIDSHDFFFFFPEEATEEDGIEHYRELTRKERWFRNDYGRLTYLIKLLDGVNDSAYIKPFKIYERIKRISTVRRIRDELSYHVTGKRMKPFIGTWYGRELFNVLAKHDGLTINDEIIEFMRINKFTSYIVDLVKASLTSDGISVNASESESENGNERERVNASENEQAIASESGNEQVREQAIASESGRGRGRGSGGSGSTRDPGRGRGRSSGK